MGQEDQLAHDDRAHEVAVPEERERVDVGVEEGEVHEG